MSRPKLCMVLPCYDPDTAEHLGHLYDLLDELAQRVDLHVIAVRARGRPRFHHVRHLYLQRRGGPLWRALKLLALLLRVRLQGCRRFYVHYSYYGGLLVPWVTKLFGGTSFYWNCSGPDPKLNGEAPPGRRILRALRSRLPQRLSIQWADHLVTGTPGLAEEYRQRFRLPRGKVKVLPNFVAEGRFSPQAVDRTSARRSLGLEPKDKVILFLHWLSTRKGAQHILPLVERLCARNIEGVFLVGGGGPLLDPLREEVARKGYQKSVRLLGPIANREVPKYFAAADLFIMPSEEEGFPRVLLEAMAMGVPFVATDVGGVREVLWEEQRSCLVPAGEVETFAAKVAELLADEEAWRRLRAVGLERVGEFTLGRVTERFLETVVA